jgi:hypothetical protein
MQISTLRSASLGALVVATAAQGDYASIVCLSQSGMWDAEADAYTAVAALLAAPQSTLHDVHCRRGLDAVLHGNHSTRARAVLRSRAFADAFGRIFEDGLVDYDAAARLVRMGPSKSLKRACSRAHAPAP